MVDRIKTCPLSEFSTSAIGKTALLAEYLCAIPRRLIHVQGHTLSTWCYRYGICPRLHFEAFELERSDSCMNFVAGNEVLKI